MNVLPLQFGALQYLGLWCDQPSRQRYLLVKYIWKPLVVCSIVYLTLVQLAAMSIYRDNIGEFTECLFLSLTWLGSCLKMFNFLWRRDEMNDLLSEFRQIIFVPRDDDEDRIIARYRRDLRFIFTTYLSVTQSSAASFALLPLVSYAFGNNSIHLPYKTYEFIDYGDHPTHLSIAYVFQVATIVADCLMNVTMDTLVSGFILLICAQIDICRWRFVVSTSTTGDHAKATKDCAVHQQSIRRIVRKIQSFFMLVIMPQLLFSLISLCTSLYNLTRMKIVESFVFVMYLCCLQCQIFFYCWFGNELKLKSSAICETIYHSDLTAFSPSDKKNLYFIGLVCQKDMSISFHGFCPVTLEIYIWVLKTSYAVYNLLKTVEAANG